MPKKQKNRKNCEILLDSDDMRRLMTTGGTLPMTKVSYPSLQIVSRDEYKQCSNITVSGSELLRQTQCFYGCTLKSAYGVHYVVTHHATVDTVHHELKKTKLKDKVRVEISRDHLHFSWDPGFSECMHEVDKALARIVHAFSTPMTGLYHVDQPIRIQGLEDVVHVLAIDIYSVYAVHNGRYAVMHQNGVIVYEDAEPICGDICAATHFVKIVETHAECLRKDNRAMGKELSECNKMHEHEVSAMMLIHEEERETWNRTISNLRKQLASVSKTSKPKTHKWRDEVRAQGDECEFDAFLCPIGLCLLRDPVVASDGHTYERGEIQKHMDWQKGVNVCSPKTNDPLRDLTLVPNHALRAAIRDVFGA